jgi:hypothetical protein
MSVLPHDVSSTEIFKYMPPSKPCIDNSRNQEACNINQSWDVNVLAKQIDFGVAIFFYKLDTNTIFPLFENGHRSCLNGSAGTRLRAACPLRPLLSILLIVRDMRLLVDGVNLLIWTCTGFWQSIGVAGATVLQ